MTLVPRPYQASALKAGLAAMAPRSPQLLVLPTGTGKTPLGLWLAEGMVERRAGVVLLIVHRDNLLREWESLFAGAGWRVEIEQGDRRADIEQGELSGNVVVIMMKQTGRSKAGYAARYTRIMPQKIAGVIWDEAHRTVAPSELAMLGHYDTVPVVGLTATPQVPGLADNWTIAYQLTLSEAVIEGWLSPPKLENVKVKGWDWGDMRPPSGEDISPRDLREHYEGPAGALRVGPPQRRIRQRLHETGAQSLVFVPFVPFGRALTNWLNTPMSEADQALQVAEWIEAERSSEWIEEMLPKMAKPIIAALVTGGTLNVERQNTLSRMANGTCQVVVSIGVYIDGLNIENLGMIVMMRPTMLAHLYIQMMGRGLRLHTSIKHAIGLLKTAGERRALIASSPKPKCIILALVPQRAKLDFVTLAKLIAADLEGDFVPQGRGKPFDGTFDELLAHMEEQRAKWDAAEKARKDRLQMIEAAQREKRSRHLVAPGDEQVTTTTQDMLHVPTVPVSALGMSWASYQVDDCVKECATQKQFIKARRTRAEELFKRAQAVKRYRAKDGTPGFEDFHGSVSNRDWDRWQKRRAKKHLVRDPGPWRSFREVREELYRHYRWALIQVFKVPPDDVYSKETGERVATGASTKANLLSGLAYGWDQASVRTEADYWHNKHDSSYEGHRQAWARKQHHGGKRRKKASR